MSLLGSARDMIKEDRIYTVKLIRLYEPEPKLIWFGDCYFHIQRRPNGDIGVLAPKLNLSWAEYCQEDMELDEDGYINCVCEDYLMVIT